MKRQTGFTLIELMIVVAIIGILAAVAIPAYQDYLKRSKITEVAAAAGACKTSVAEYAASQNKLPADVAAAGCSSQETPYVKTLAVAAGVISVEIQNVDTAVNTKLLTLTPYADAAMATKATDGSAIAAWKCTTDAANTAWKFFPANCRG